MVECQCFNLHSGDCGFVAVRVDVSDTASVAKMVERLVAHFGRLDGAINAAGVEGARGPIHNARASATSSPASS